MWTVNSQKIQESTLKVMKTRKKISKINKGKRNIQNVISPHINNGEVESLVEYSLKYQVRIKSYDFLKIIF